MRSSVSSQGVIYEQVQEMEKEKMRMEYKLKKLQSQNYEEKVQVGKLEDQLQTFLKENQQLRDEISQYELMETKYKCQEKEVKNLKLEKERIVNDYK